MINITENSNNSYSLEYIENDNNYQCGAIIRSNNGYGNYIITDNIENFTTPTNDNFIDWYQIKDFQDISIANIKYIRPVKNTLHNSTIYFDNNIVKGSEANFYNPNIANETLKTFDFVGNICVIAKNPRAYNTNKISVHILTTENNYNTEFCNYDTLDSFDNTLKNSDNTALKTWNDIIPANDFSKSYIMLLTANSNGLYTLLESLVIKKSDNTIINKIDSDYIYFKRKTDINVDTTNYNINELFFVDTLLSTDFSITDVELTNAINILKSDKNINSFLSFEFDNNINFIGSQLLNSDKYFNFVSLYNITRYKNDVYNQIVSDFIGNNNYFNTKYDNTVVIANMYQKYDNYNNKYRFVSCAGLYAGLLYKTGLTKIIDFDYNLGETKLLYYPTIEQRTNLYTNFINSFFRKNKIVYVQGNRNYNSKYMLRYLNQNFISKLISNNLKTIKEKYNSLNVKNIEKYLRVIVNEIEIVLRKYEFDISANSIQVYNVSENNYGIEVLIYFKDFIEEFSVNINIEI